MRTQEVRKLLAEVLPKLETPVAFDHRQFKHLRRRRADSMQNSCYYGGHYFDPHTASMGSPELHLCQSAITCPIRHGSDLFTVWVCGLGTLEVIMRRPAHGSAVDWSFYSFIRLNDEGPVMVFMQNRGRFACELAEATGNHRVCSCDDLRRGRLHSAN